MSFRRQRKAGNPERAADPSAACGAAVALLARRDFATGELSAKLLRQGFEAAVVASTIAELIQERALDDARYADNYARYHAGRGQGPVRIAADLKALGLAEELIRTALAAVPDWVGRAEEVRRHRFGAEKPGDGTQKARQARFLQYRGFSSDHIRLALGADFDPD